MRSHGGHSNHHDTSIIATLNQIYSVARLTTYQRGKESIMSSNKTSSSLAKLRVSWCHLHTSTSDDSVFNYVIVNLLIIAGPTR